jgi:hypothetical protein
MTPMRLLLVLLLVHGSAASAWAQSKPKIILSERAWDFGERDQGWQAEKRIEVTNAGEGMLFIKKVGVTCGCIAASAMETEVPAKGTTTIVVTINTMNVSGAIAKEVWIDCNDPQQRRIAIPIHGKVLQAFAVTPQNLSFGDCDLASNPVRRFRVAIMGKRDVQLKAVKAGTPRIILTRQPFELPDGTRGFDYDVTLAPDTPLGPFTGTIIVETTAPFVPVATLLVHAKILGTVTAFPDRLNFGLVKQAQPKTIKMRITKRHGEGLAIEKVACSDPDIAIQTQEITPGKVFEMDVTLTMAPGHRQRTGKIYVFTNEPSQKLVTVDYTALAAPAR